MSLECSWGSEKASMAGSMSGRFHPWALWDTCPYPSFFQSQIGSFPEWLETATWWNADLYILSQLLFWCEADLAERERGELEMLPLHLKGWLHRRGHIFGGRSIPTIPGAGCGDSVMHVQKGMWSWVCCRASPESLNIRNISRITESSYLCRIQRLPATGLRAAVSEYCSVGPKGISRWPSEL